MSSISDVRFQQLSDELEKLREERDTFHMSYRMKCDVDTKAALVRAERAEAERDKLRETLRSVEFASRGYCPSCDGWMASPNGSTRGKHMKNCILAAALQEPPRARETYPIGWSGNDGPNGQTT